MAQFNKKGLKITASFLNACAACLLVLVAAFFYYFVYQNAINVPYFDDFAYLRYVLNFQKTPSVLEFLRLLEEKHNGHGVITAKLVFWLNGLIEGQINFRTLTIIGSGLVLILFNYFRKILNTNKIDFFYLFPVGLLLFTPAYHENIFWAAALWQYTASFVVGIATYYALAQPSRWTLAMAALLGFLMTYTNGNGLFGMYIGAVIPLLQGRYKRLGGWLLACVLTTIVFYWYYPFGFGSLAEARTLRGSFLTIVSFFGAAGHYLRGGLLEVAITGASVVLSLFGGLGFLTVLFLGQFFKRQKNGTILVIFTRSPANLSLLALLAWLAITGLGVAVARASNSLESPARYMIYSVVTLAALYVAALLILPARLQKWLAFGMTGFGTVFVVGTYLFAAPNVINFRNSLAADAYSLRQHRRVSGKVETMTNINTLKTFEDAVATGLYVIPPTQLDGIETLPAVSSSVLRFSIQRDTMPVYGGILRYKIKNEDFLFDQSQPRNGLYVLLKNQLTNKIYCNAPQQNPNRGRGNFLRTGHYFAKGFEATFYEDNLPPGTYQIGLFFCENGKRRVVYSRQKIEI